MLFFLHIPKTAGTSLRAQASQWCKPGDVVESYGNELCPARPDSEFIGAVKLQSPRTKMIIGHFGWGARELLDQPTAPYATILRDPISRAVSFFGHVQREPRSRHYRPIQSGMGLKDLVYSHTAPELNNHYVRTCLGSDRWRLSLWPPDPTTAAQPIDQLFDRRHLEEAWSRMVTHFCYVGRTERYGKALATLAKMLKITHIGDEQRLNVFPPELPRPIVDAETEAVLRRYNALDIELYQRVVERWG